MDFLHSLLISYYTIVIELNNVDFLHSLVITLLL